MIRGLSLDLATRVLKLRFIAESTFALSLSAVVLDPVAPAAGRWLLTRTLVLRRAAETDSAWVTRINTVLGFLPGTRLGFRPELLIEDGIITIRCHIVGVKFGLVTGEEP